MGFDVHGLNPRINNDNFKTYNKYKDMDFSDKWKILDNNKKLKEKYWKEEDEFQAANPGTYFRNNCWWWRPLWDYVCINCKSLTEDDHRSGHYNDGHKISEEKATLIGLALKAQLKEGAIKEYADRYKTNIEALPKVVCTLCNGNNYGNKKKKDCHACKRTGEVNDFSSFYPFDVENVKEFAEFCLQSGGFRIS